MTRTRVTGAAVALALLALPSAANATDRDHDRMPDRWEKSHKLNPKRDDARRDRDRDGLRNLQEYRAGTDPSDRDSDDDGRRDGRENAGRIASFDSATGTLTVSLFGGGTVSGKVDGTTEIECENEDDRGTATGDTRGDGTPEDRVAAHHGDDDEDEESCSSAALTEGRIVKEAELHTGDDGDHGTWDEVELR